MYIKIYTKRCTTIDTNIYNYIQIYNIYTIHKYTYIYIFVYTNIYIQINIYIYILSVLKIVKYTLKKSICLEDVPGKNRNK